MFSCCLSGCSTNMNSNDTYSDKQTVSFLNEKPSDCSTIDYQNSEEYKSYSSVYSEYNTYTYYSTLLDKEKTIYHIFEYAFDNSYPYIVLGNGVLTEIETSVDDILYFLSLDSPMIEQNLNISQTVQTYTITDPEGNSEHTKYHIIFVNCFTEEKMDKKKQAIEKGKEFVSTIPPHLTYKDKAERIYNYLGQNITYSAYGENEDPNYLYDAICMNKTQCDGFANAFSLLCNMVGIPCFEKCNLPEDGSEGHTWNTFQIDGKWYNADVTGYKSSLDNNCPVSLLFGYSDEFQTNIPKYTDKLPECNNIINLDCTFKNDKDSDILKTIKNSYNSNGKDYIIIHTKERLDNPSVLMQDIADTLSFNITYSTIDNRLFCIYKTELT